MFLMVVVTMLNQQMGVLVLGSVLGAEAASVFDIAWKASMLMAMPLIIVNMALGPIVSSSYVQPDFERLQRAARMTSGLALAGAAPVAIAPIAGGGPLLRILNPELEQGKTALTILCFGQLINVGAGSVGLLLNMTGHERDALRGMLLGVAVNAVLSLSLVVALGVEGVAWSVAASYLAWNGYQFALVRRRLRISSTILGGFTG